MATKGEVMLVNNWHLDHIHGIVATILTVIVLVICALAYGGWLVYQMAVKDIAKASAAIQSEMDLIKGKFQQLSATVNGTVQDIESTMRSMRGTLQTLGSTMNRTATTMSTLRAPNQAVHMPK